jgi:predicted nucleic acid-binding protein
MSVFDCNVFVQAIAFPGAAYHCFARVMQGPDRLLTSKYVIEEARYVLSMPWLRAKLPGLTPARVEALFHHLSRAAVHVHPVPKLFDFPPDPADAPYIDLALYTGAFALVTRDRQVLRLANFRDEYGRLVYQRHPSLHVVVPEKFLELTDEKPSLSDSLSRQSVRRNRERT